MDRPDPAPSRAREWSEVVLALGLIAGLVVLLSLNVGGSASPLERPEDVDALEQVIREIVGWLAAGAEIAAAAVIGWGVLQGIGAYGLRLVRRGGDEVDATEGIRLRLGRILALGIEFTLASDILRTAVAPTRADILTLGAIVLLRTLLNLFLEREIREGEAKRGAAEGAA